MACSTGLTGGRGRAFGGFLSGSGIGSVISAATGGAVNASVATAALSAVAGASGAVGANPLTQITSAVATAVGSAGGGSLISAALSGAGPVGSVFAGQTDFIGSLVAQATAMMPIDISSSLQIFDQVSGFADISKSIMQNATRALGTEFGAISGLAKNFTDGGFLGDNIGNFNDMITNGVAGLTDGLSGSITDLGSSLLNVGKFGDFTDLSNLMNPGQLVGQMLDNGLGDISGLANNLLANGIPLGDLSNPLYQNKIQSVMNGITSITDLADIQKVMGSSINLNSLGQLTDITKVIDTNIATTFNSFADLGGTLQKMSTGVVSNMGEFGDMVSNVSGVGDLTNLIQENTVLDQSTFNAISSYMGGGTGPDGGILTRDLLGSAAAYGHDVYMDAYTTATTALTNAGTTSTVQAMYGEISAGLNGSYTIGPNITDPRTTISYTVLDDFVTAKAAQISSEFASLDIATDPYINAVRTNWNNSAQAVTTEVNLLAQTDIDPSLVTAGHKGSMHSFASRLGDMGKDEHDTSHLLERVATSDIHGEAVKYSLREGRNLSVYQSNEAGYVGAIRDTLEPTITWTDPDV